MTKKNAIIIEILSLWISYDFSYVTMIRKVTRAPRSAISIQMLFCSSLAAPEETFKSWEDSKAHYVLENHRKIMGNHKTIKVVHKFV